MLFIILNLAQSLLWDIEDSWESKITFGIRSEFLEAYSHSLLIFLSFGDSSCETSIHPLAKFPL